MDSDQIPKLNVLGTEVAAVNFDQAVGRISDWLSDGKRGRFVSVVDVNCIMQSYRRREVRMAYRAADICVPDGMPLTWVGRLQGHSRMGRVYGPDLMLSLLGQVEGEQSGYDVCPADESDTSVVSICGMIFG